MIVLIGLLTLDSCTSAEGPLGKSQAQLNFENGICSRRSAGAPLGYTQQVYAQCMLNFNNTVHLADGTTLTPRQYAYVPPPPSPPYTPLSIGEPDESSDANSAPEVPPVTPPPAENGSTTPHKWVFTEEQKKRFATDFAIQSAKAYLICRGEEHRWRCAAASVIRGMGPDEREAVCTDPDMLRDFLHVSDELEQDIVQLLNCSA